MTLLLIRLSFSAKRHLGLGLEISIDRPHNEGRADDLRYCCMQYDWTHDSLKIKHLEALVGLREYVAKMKGNIKSTPSSQQLKSANKSKLSKAVNS